MLVFLAATGSAIGQTPESYSGQVSGWNAGQGQLILINSNDWPPPRTLPPDAMVVGSVTPDGQMSVTLPESMPEDEFVPAGGFLDPGCENLTVTPADAQYYPIELIAYSMDGDMIGIVFLANPGAAGPAPGGYSVLMGYSAQPYSLSGSCPQRGRSVIEEYDFSVEPGWHSIVQRFSEHPEEEGMRLDRWTNEDVPEDATWILERPPR